MIRKFKSLLIIIGLLSMSSCGVGELDKEDFVKWVEDESNGLKVSKEIGIFNFELQYKPVDYLLAKEYMNKALPGKEELERKMNEVSDLQHFNLKVLLKNSNQDMIRYGTQSEEEYQQKIYYFSFPAQGDFRLVDGKDTLSCVLYHFERSYNLAPYSNFVLGFNKPASSGKASSKTLLYEDKVLGTGLVKFKIDSLSILNIPIIKIDQ